LIEFMKSHVKIANLCRFDYFKIQLS